MRVAFPRDGQSFALDVDGPSRQEIVLSATVSVPHARFVIDGQPGRELGPPFRMPWLLSPGVHRLELEAGGVRSEAVTFAVTAP